MPPRSDRSLPVASPRRLGFLDEVAKNVFLLSVACAASLPERIHDERAQRIAKRIGGDLMHTDPAPAHQGRGSARGHSARVKFIDARSIGTPDASCDVIAELTPNDICFV